VYCGVLYDPALEKVRAALSPVALRLGGLLTHDHRASA
jgi:hypothetical protein